VQQVGSYPGTPAINGGGSIYTGFSAANKERLVRYTVDPPTAAAVAISSSLVPASAANRI
jgi:hypothetical protein